MFLMGNGWEAPFPTQGGSNTRWLKVPLPGNVKKLETPTSPAAHHPECQAGQRPFGNTLEGAGYLPPLLQRSLHLDGQPLRPGEEFPPARRYIVRLARLVVDVGGMGAVGPGEPAQSRAGDWRGRW